MELVQKETDFIVSSICQTCFSFPATKSCGISSWEKQGNLPDFDLLTNFFGKIDFL